VLSEITLAPKRCSFALLSTGFSLVVLAVLACLPPGNRFWSICRRPRTPRCCSA
jgi:hypothetical protein